MEDIEITDNAQHESVRVAVELKVVDMALSDIAEVAGAESDATERNVNGQEMTTTESIEGVGEADVMVCIT